MIFLTLQSGSMPIISGECWNVSCPLNFLYQRAPRLELIEHNAGKLDQLDHGVPSLA